MNAGNRNRGAGHQLYSQLRSLIQEAATWPEADKASLRNAGVEIFDWLGIKKDDTNRKKLLRSLMPTETD